MPLRLRRAYEKGKRPRYQVEDYALFLQRDFHGDWELRVYGEKEWEWLVDLAAGAYWPRFPTRRAAAEFAEALLAIAPLPRYPVSDPPGFCLRRVEAGLYQLLNDDGDEVGTLRRQHLKSTGLRWWRYHSDGSFYGRSYATLDMARRDLLDN